MSKNEKIRTIIAGAVILVLGVLIAIFGMESVFDTVLGILCLVGGVALLTLGVIGIAKKQPLQFATLFGGCAFIAIGVSLLVGFLSIAALIAFLMIVLIALGGALVIFGVYTIVKGAVVTGVIQIVIGAAIAVLAGLYIGVADFQTAFWIIIGVVIALYGALLIVSPWLPKKKAA